VSELCTKIGHIIVTYGPGAGECETCKRLATNPTAPERPICEICGDEIGAYVDAEAYAALEKENAELRERAEHHQARSNENYLRACALIDERDDAIAEAARLKAALVEISALAGQDEHELSAGPDVARKALGRGE
jgi:hypothetical protein